jgi:hypothetical protein
MESTMESIHDKNKDTIKMNLKLGFITYPLFIFCYDRRGP